MEDYLKDIIDEQKESLIKYSYKNVRTKDVLFHSFNKESDTSEIALTSEVNAISSSYKNLRKNKEEFIELKETKKSDSINATTNIENVTNISNNQNNVNNTNDSNDIVDFNSYISMLSTQFEKDKELKKKQEKEMSSKKISLAEKRKTIVTTYLYLFDIFQNYSLCFEEFNEIVSKFPQFVKTIPVIKESPKKIKVRDFIYKLRTVALIQKTNIIAYQIGQYNFSLFAEIVSEIDMFKESTPEDLALRISKKYNGTDLDLEALVVFLDVAHADMSGEIIFENLKQKTLEEKEKEKENLKIENKKANRKKSLGFDSFSLKNKKN